MRARQAGFALLAALWTMVLVGALAGAYMAAAQRAVRTSANRNAALKARHAALAGLARVENALERLEALSAREVELDIVTRARLTRVWNHLDSAFANSGVECIGTACYELEIRDLSASLNVNRAGEQEMRQFLVALDADYRSADIAAQSIADWKDPDHLHRARGAERDHYLALRFPHEPRNGPLRDVSELRRIRGMRELYASARPFVTTGGSGRINLNSAPEPVLAALPGLDELAVRMILNARRRGFVFTNPYQISALLPADVRARLQSNYPTFVARVAFEPREIEVVSTGRGDETGVRVRIRAVFVRAGGRIARVRQVRLAG